jgi:hypothetical protein
VLREAGRMTRLTTMRNPIGRFIRNNVAWLVTKLPAFRRNFVRYLAEMTIHYPTSPLNGEAAGPGWKSGGTKPGDRVPDTRLRDAHSGRDERLLRILRGTSHHLLLMPEGTDSATLNSLADIRQRVEAAYAGTVQTHLIVPVGWVPAGSEGFSSLWLDSQTTVRRLLGARTTALALVRPDGYLGYRGQPAMWASLHEYLQSYLIARPG